MVTLAPFTSIPGGRAYLLGWLQSGRSVSGIEVAPILAGSDDGVKLCFHAFGRSTIIIGCQPPKSESIKLPPAGMDAPPAASSRPKCSGWRPIETYGTRLPQTKRLRRAASPVGVENPIEFSNLSEHGRDHFFPGRESRGVPG